MNVTDCSVCASNQMFQHGWNVYSKARLQVGRRYSHASFMVQLMTTMVQCSDHRASG